VPVEYSLSVGDLIGYYLTDYRTTTEVYSVVGAYDMPVFDCAPTNLGVLEVSDAEVSSNLVIHNYGMQDLVWTSGLSASSARVAFEDPAAPWSHAGDGDEWHLSTNRVYRGTNAWYCGNDATRQYADACHAWLDTPPLTIGAGGLLTFHQWIRTENDADDLFWDGGVIACPRRRRLVRPRHARRGIPYRITQNPDSPFPADQPCLAGSATRTGGTRSPWICAPTRASRWWSGSSSDPTSTRSTRGGTSAIWRSRPAREPPGWPAGGDGRDLHPGTDRRRLPSLPIRNRSNATGKNRPSSRSRTTIRRA
jgi:hypothetical protein